ncbi:GNAT family N-acetyltransferase [Kineococcus sp. GCM10028916]|uniref:GNAT family N-acetyltransferase n=1 Tax=Kineococcus sp. GCM10028916 TaxID=3273394 RepID=UPI00362A0976
MTGERHTDPPAPTPACRSGPATSTSAGAARSSWLPRRRPTTEPGATEEFQLHLIYVDAAHHGCGAGPALLHAVLDPDESAALWVADPNPRAQAFYRKHRFLPDGRSKSEDGVREARWVRPTGTS